jgi:dinuclear metal center YbgI/SA1388 family protein
VTTGATVSGVTAVMEELFPARWADADDPVGLAVGDPGAAVRRVLLTVDPVRAVVDEAIAVGADMIIAHHPLLFRAVHTVAAATPKGRVVHDLIRAGMALFVAHTNADSAPGGVSESLAMALGLQDIEPIEPAADEPLDKVITFVPASHSEALVDALSAAGAGSIGAYDRCAFLTSGEGTFRPTAGARPTIGTVGRVEVVDEQRIEMVLPRTHRARVVRALRQAHPYEEPAFDVFELAPFPARHGTGRIGRLPRPMQLHEFAQRVVSRLPRTAVGARVSGDLDGAVSVVGLLGGAGDFLLDAARGKGVDVFVTSDLRHHPASEFREHDGAPALVDIPHWAAEATWLPRLAELLTTRLAAGGHPIACQVSTVCTDPWNHAVVPDIRADVSAIRL